MTGLDILFDLMFENGGSPRAWQWESDWSPAVPRFTLENLERQGFIEIDRADSLDWRVRQTMRGEQAALDDRVA